MIRKIFALLKKELLIELSYKLSFILSILASFSSILIYFFIDKLFGGNVSPFLNEFGVDYFSYVLIGMAFFNYIGTGIGSFSSRIRLEQMQGTFESLLLCPIKISTLLASMGIWNIIFASLNLILYFFAGKFIFGIDFSNINFLSTFTILILTIISFSSLGIISASFTLYFKRGNPLSWLVNTLEGVLGGVYFPIAVMPPLLQIVSKFLPITYAIRALQLSIYKNYSIFQLQKELLILLILSIILLPLSFKIFKFSFNKARYSGSLSQY